MIVHLIWPQFNNPRQSIKGEEDLTILLQEGFEQKTIFKVIKVMQKLGVNKNPEKHRGKIKLSVFGHSVFLSYLLKTRWQPSTIFSDPLHFDGDPDPVVSL